MRILIIESDPATSQAVSAALMVLRFEVLTAADGQAGLTAAQTQDFDLILLEASLPRRDGFSVVQALRQADNQTPIIFLTSRNAVEDRIRGLELGADDYITKPFSPGEVVARIKTVLRRASGRTRADRAAQDAGLMHIGDLEMDLNRHRAFRAGQRLGLTPKEFALLSLLARRRGEALTREFIASEVWDTRFKKDTNVVDVHVRRLRAKLDDPYDQKLVVTVRGIGYMLTDGAAQPEMAKAATA